ncbi:hypothetical protein ABZW03_26215 [Kitasatospora sp. NPDC004799]|uniref:hypothetical protein n=1 Tax=Kitasatospora sp. NPDC004799 TaxID=3154460 RepID=UPI0033BB5EB3
MQLFRRNQQPQSGQQRRAADVRRADREGQRQIDSHRTSQSTTAWHRAPAARAWWRSS